MKSILALTFSTILLSFTARAEVVTASYPGWDAPGNDIESFLAGSQANCARTCLERADCQAADYDSRPQRCWLKSRGGTPVRSAYNTLTLKTLLGKDGIDYPGGDYRSYASGNAQNCAHQCYVETQCKAFAFDKNTAICWLKNAVVDASFESNVIAGRK